MLCSIVFLLFRGTVCKKAPCPCGDRGRKYFAVPPLVRHPQRDSLTPCQTRQRGNGRSRSTPTAFFQRFGCRLRGVFHSHPSPLFTDQGFSLQGCFCVLLRINALCRWYFTRYSRYCQSISLFLTQNNAKQSAFPRSVLKIVIAVSSGSPPRHPAVRRHSPKVLPSHGCRR